VTLCPAAALLAGAAACETATVGMVGSVTGGADEDECAPAMTAISTIRATRLPHPMPMPLPTLRRGGRYCCG
jgi:hypothetical protein